MIEKGAAKLDMAHISDKESNNIVHDNRSSEARWTGLPDKYTASHILHKLAGNKGNIFYFCNWSQEIETRWSESLFILQGSHEKDSKELDTGE